MLILGQTHLSIVLQELFSEVIIMQIHKLCCTSRLANPQKAEDGNILTFHEYACMYFYKQCVLPAVSSVSARSSNVPPAALRTRQQILAVLLQLESSSCFCQEGICSHLLWVQTGTFNDNPQKCWCVTQAHPSVRLIKPVLEEVGMRERLVRLDPESIPDQDHHWKLSTLSLSHNKKMHQIGSKSFI